MSQTIACSDVSELLASGHPLALPAMFIRIPFESRGLGKKRPLAGPLQGAKKIFLRVTARDEWLMQRRKDAKKLTLLLGGFA